MGDLTPQQKRKLDEIMHQQVWDGGDAGELVNAKQRLDRYEEILAKVADVLGCQSDFGMILPNLLALKQIEQAAILLRSRCIVEGVGNPKMKEGYHVEIRTDAEAWKKFWDALPVGKRALKDGLE